MGFIDTVLPAACTVYVWSILSCSCVQRCRCRWFLLLHAKWQFFKPGIALGAFSMFLLADLGSLLCHVECLPPFFVKHETAGPAFKCACLSFPFSCDRIRPLTVATWPACMGDWLNLIACLPGCLSPLGAGSWVLTCQEDGFWDRVHPSLRPHRMKALPSGRYGWPAY